MIFLLFVACTSKDNNEKENQDNPSKNENTKLDIVKNISISCDTLPYNFEYSSVYKKDNELYFVGLDEPTNALYFYSITNQKYSHRIHKPTEGNKKFIIKDFYIHTKDSIFLLDDYSTKAQIIDDKGNIIRNLKFRNEEDRNIVETSSSKRFVFFSELNKFILPSYVEIEDTKEEFYKHGFSSVFVQKEDSLVLLSEVGKYPKEYMPIDNSYFYSTYPNMTKYQNKFILNFSNHHSLFSINIENEMEQIVEWKSNYLKEDFERLPLEHDIQQSSNYIAINGFYTRITVDEETETLYRMVKHPQPLKNAEGKLNQYLECGFSIMYGKIDDPSPKEVLLEKEKYVPYVVHSIGNNQLLISLENPFNPNNKENMLEFEIIELK
jgi:folate-binding Fe-S cluster repair protein YgfZ